MKCSCVKTLSKLKVSLAIIVSGNICPTVAAYEATNLLQIERETSKFHRDIYMSIEGTGANWSPAVITPHSMLSITDNVEYDVPIDNNMRDNRYILQNEKKRMIFRSLQNDFIIVCYGQ